MKTFGYSWRLDDEFMLGNFNQLNFQLKKILNNMIIDNDEENNGYILYSKLIKIYDKIVFYNLFKMELQDIVDNAISETSRIKEIKNDAQLLERVVMRKFENID